MEDWFIIFLHFRDADATEMKIYTCKFFFISIDLIIRLKVLFLRIM